MQYSLFFLLAALLGSTSVAAQPTYKLGLRGGLNRAITTLDAASTGTDFFDFRYSADKSAIYSWQTGAVLEIDFGKFALQPALLFSQKGEQFNTASSFGGVNGRSGNTTRSTNQYYWLELPVNVVYSLCNLQLFGGPYAALGVGGRRRGTTLNYSPTAKFAPSEFNERIRFGPDTYNPRLDAGVNFGIGYRKGPFQAQFSYQLGLLTLHRSNAEGLIGEFPYHDFNTDDAYNRVLQLTGTYFFKL